MVDRWDEELGYRRQERAEGGTVPQRNPHAERHAEVAHREPESQSSQSPEGTEEIGPAECVSALAYEHAVEIMRHQQCQQRWHDDPREETADHPGGLPGPLPHEAVGNVKASRCKTAEPVK